MQGSIEYVSVEKGFGFIRVEGYEKNVFFHVRDMVSGDFDTLKKGDVVSIDNIEETLKGFACKGVKLI